MAELVASGGEVRIEDAIGVRGVVTVVERAERAGEEGPEEVSVVLAGRADAGEPAWGGSVVGRGVCVRAVTV